jgi:hypothetical protein
MQWLSPAATGSHSGCCSYPRPDAGLWGGQLPSSREWRNIHHAFHLLTCHFWGVSRAMYLPSAVSLAGFPWFHCTRADSPCSRPQQRMPLSSFQRPLLGFRHHLQEGRLAGRPTMAQLKWMHNSLHQVALKRHPSTDIPFRRTSVSLNQT